MILVIGDGGVSFKDKIALCMCALVCVYVHTCVCTHLCMYSCTCLCKSMSVCVILEVLTFLIMVLVS